MGGKKDKAVAIRRQMVSVIFNCDLEDAKKEQLADLLYELCEVNFDAGREDLFSCAVERFCRDLDGEHNAVKRALFSSALFDDLNQRVA